MTKGEQVLLEKVCVQKQSGRIQTYTQCVVTSIFQREFCIERASLENDVYNAKRGKASKREVRDGTDMNA